jgi:hypothetical protein
MSRMLDLIRANSLSWHQLMTASKGALQVPAEQMVEILVYLAEHNKIMGGQARLTLAAWDEASAKTIAANPTTPKEVLDYWISSKNLRPPLFPLLISNTSVTIGKLSELATSLKGEWIDVMISSPRVRGSQQLLADLSSNKELTEVQTVQVQELISGKSAVAVAEPDPAAQGSAVRPLDPGTPASSPEIVAVAAEPTTEATAKSVETNPQALVAPPDPETDEALIAFFTQYADEIAAEGDKPFRAIGAVHEEMLAEPEMKSFAAAAAAAASPAQAASPQIAPVQPAPVTKPVLPKKLVNPEDEKRGSVLQKINRLDIKGRIQLAMKGTKEERSILVRDGTKLVAIAVLDSPKISDGEVEKIASQRNVLESVLRAIPLKRRFMKNYGVVRNLVFNPRTPIDISLGLMKQLLAADLKNLTGNKEVSDTIRKLALRMFKQKTENPNR